MVFIRFFGKDLPCHTLFPNLPDCVLRLARAEAAEARAVASCTDAMIQELKLEIANLRRDKSGISSKRRARLIDQL